MSLPNELLPLGLLGIGAAAAEGYAIERSVRFNSSDSAYLSDDTAASGGNTTTWTLSMWLKRSSFTPAASTITVASAFITPDNTGALSIFFDANDKLGFGAYSTTWRLSTQVFRDYSAWYNFVFVWDTSNGTANDRVRIYVNGFRITAFDTINDPGLNAASPFCNNQPGSYDPQNIISKTRSIGVNAWYQLRPFGGYIADVHCIQGQALDPTSFGEFDDNGIWQPIEYSGSFGTNGFHLPFDDNSTAAALGTDTSGAGNNWTVNNISVAAGAGNDSLVDVPQNGTETDTGLGNQVRGNYSVLNALTGAGTLSNGNLDFSGATGGAQRYGTIGFATGKWYWEVLVTAGSGSALPLIGIGNNPNQAGLVGIYGYYGFNGNKYQDSTATSYGASYGVNDVIGIAADFDAGTITFYKNGTTQGQAYSGLTGTFFPYFRADSGTSVVANFGQRPFAYPVSGYKSLCTANLPAPVVTKPSEYMDVKLYTGNYSTQSITTDFSPDLVWIKARNRTWYHNLFDTVRTATKGLSTNATDAERTLSNDLTAFNSNGFTLGAGLDTNESGSAYVAWAWDAGSSTVTNTDGSITSSVRANPSAGFSIMTFTAPNGIAYTVGHGLNVAPQFVIYKSRGIATDWLCFHSSIGTGKYIQMNKTDAAITLANVWDTAPSSTVVNVGYNLGHNATAVMYAFAPVAGYSAFGSYTGNGSADGPFVYTGFRPRWLMIKCSSSSQSGNAHWVLFDSARNTYNVVGNALLANVADSEYSGLTGPDILSNGFKLRDTNTSRNASAATYIYAAFAESPLQYARAR